MTVWGFLAVIVVCLAAAWAYLRKRVVVDVVDDQRAAMEKAREDAANASAQRSRTAGQIVAQGAPKAQAEQAAVKSGAAEEAVRLAGDLREQADAVAGLVGASPTRRNPTPPPSAPPERGK